MFYVLLSLLYVHSSIAIILMGKRELVALLNLSSWCLVVVERLFLVVPRGCLRFVIVVFPDHTHLLFLGMVHIDNFITVFKVTWLRKMITHPDCSWSSLSSIIINRIFSMGENYAETKGKELSNSFWKDIVVS